MDFSWFMKLPGLSSVLTKNIIIDEGYNDYVYVLFSDNFILAFSVFHYPFQSCSLLHLFNAIIKMYSISVFQIASINFPHTRVICLDINLFM